MSHYSTGECGAHSMGGAKVESDRSGLLVNHDGAYPEWLMIKIHPCTHIRDKDSFQSQNASIASSPSTSASMANFPNGMYLDRAWIAILDTPTMSLVVGEAKIISGGGILTGCEMGSNSMTPPSAESPRHYRLFAV
jgi:hypothetical protein